MQHLDPFSQAAAKHIFEAFPQWQDLARVDQAEDETAFLVIEVAAPQSADVERGLLIETANEEFTVGFDIYHEHHGQWPAALRFLKGILDEQAAVVSWFQDDVWLGSTVRDARAGLPPWPEHSTRLRIRSWNGTLNADIARDAAQCLSTLQALAERDRYGRGGASWTRDDLHERFRPDPDNSQKMSETLTRLSR